MPVGKGVWELQRNIASIGAGVGTEPLDDPDLNLVMTPTMQMVAQLTEYAPAAGLPSRSVRMFSPPVAARRSVCEIRAGPAEVEVMLFQFEVSTALLFGYIQGSAIQANQALFVGSELFPPCQMITAVGDRVTGDVVSGNGSISQPGAGTISPVLQGRDLFRRIPPGWTLYFEGGTDAVGLVVSMLLVERGMATKRVE